MARTISNTDDEVDSRDVIARIGRLENEYELSEDEAYELEALKALEEEAQSSPDWEYGEVLVHEEHFTEYIKDIIDECFEMPKDMNSGVWPYRHMTMDYEAAAEEAKADYFEVDWGGETYLIRA